MTRLLLVAALGMAVARTEEPGPGFDGLRKYIQQQMAAESVPAFSIAVARDGAILWEEGFGWADRENNIKATAHTSYYLASVTKSLTGAISTAPSTTISEWPKFTAPCLTLLRPPFAAWQITPLA